MILTLAQLTAIMPGARVRAGIFLDALNAAMEEFGITTPARVAAFLAQIAHESGELARVAENLNYTPQGILGTFGKHFTPAQAQQYGRADGHKANQIMIANIAYANRMGNGSVASGDGWKYRGRGLIQTTGRDNYTACMMALDIDCVEQPELLELSAHACRSAALFWRTNGLNALADKGDIHRITKIINGGYNGLDERLAYFATARKALA